MNENLNIKELINAYYDGETNVEESALAEKYISENAEYKQYYQSLREVSSLLTHWSTENLSPDLERRVRKDSLDRNPQEGVVMKQSNKLILAGVAGFAIAFLSFLVANNVYQRGNYQEIAKVEHEKRAADKKGPYIEVAQKVSEGTAKEESVVTTPKRSIGELAKAKRNELATAFGFKGGKMKHAADDIGDQFSTGNVDQIVLAKDQKLGAGSTLEYEPYYLEGSSDSRKTAETEAFLRQDGIAGMGDTTTRTRGGGGFQTFSYDRPVDRDLLSKKEANGAVLNGQLEYWEGGRNRRLSRMPASVSESKVIVPPYYDDYVYRWPTPDPQPTDTEEYDQIVENNFSISLQNPLSTFSIDVDTASYSNVRRFLQSNQMPPTNAVRIEEMVNYFNYKYPAPKGKHPFSVTMEMAKAPWNHNHNLVMIGIQGKALNTKEVPPNNLVFLIDVSGSMADYNKLPLLKSGFKMMVNSLSANDRISIVTYSGSAGVVLQSTPGNQKNRINQAIDNLYAGGSTAGGAGIKLAYQIARQSFIKEGNNRVILATDGDFNVGISSDDALVKLIEQNRDDGINLTVLGFGMGNYKDSKIEKLADKGNGNYAYIDTIQEAKKVLVTELGTMLFTIAKDVKLQLEFNPAFVHSYRLIGYENRAMANRDFNDDTKDAGDIGAGHTVTAFYEIIPVGSEEIGDPIPLQYQDVKIKQSNDLLTLKLRYKHPGQIKSNLITESIDKRAVSVERTSENFRFTSSVVEFGLLLRNSAHKGSSNYHSAINRAQGALGQDTFGYRAEFIQLLKRAQQLDTRIFPEPPHEIQFKGDGIQFKGTGAE